MDPRSILGERLRKFLAIGYRQYRFLFFVCRFEGSYALTSKLKVRGHKHFILWLTDNDIYSRILLINLWEELRRLFCYRQHVSIFQASKGDSVGYWSLSRNQGNINLNLNPPVFRSIFTHRIITKYVLQNENCIEEPLCRTNFSQHYISYCGPYLWNNIVISKKLTFSDSGSLQAFKCELKRFLLSVELNHLGILE